MFDFQPAALPTGPRASAFEGEIVALRNLGDVGVVTEYGRRTSSRVEIMVWNPELAVWVNGIGTTLVFWTVVQNKLRESSGWVVGRLERVDGTQGKYAYMDLTWDSECDAATQTQEHMDIEALTELVDFTEFVAKFVSDSNLVDTVGSEKEADELAADRGDN